MTHSASATLTAPKVFVGITTYNHQDFIAACLDSIRLQNYPNMELVVSDDCSQDGTVAAIHAYQAKHPDFPFAVIAHNPNVGITGNCNGLLARSGDAPYFLWFAGDDIMRPGKIAKQVKALEDNPEASFCYSDCEWFQSATGRKICNHFGILQRPPRDIYDLVRDFTIPTPTLLMRKSRIPANGFETRLRFLSDFFICLMLMKNGPAIYLAENLVRYRKHGNSMMANHFFLEDRREIIAILSADFKDDPRMTDALKAYRAIYAYSYVCENFLAHNYHNAMQRLPDILPYCFTSIKWLARDVRLALCFVKSITTMIKTKR